MEESESVYIVKMNKHQYICDHFADFSIYSHNPIARGVRTCVSEPSIINHKKSPTVLLVLLIAYSFDYSRRIECHT